MLRFNQPSIAEVYMDEVLEKQKIHPNKIIIDDAFKEAVKTKFSFWNQTREEQLAQTHQYVMQQLN